MVRVSWPGHPVIKKTKNTVEVEKNRKNVKIKKVGSGNGRGARKLT